MLRRRGARHDQGDRPLVDVPSFPLGPPANRTMPPPLHSGESITDPWSTPGPAGPPPVVPPPTPGAHQWQFGHHDLAAERTVRREHELALGAKRRRRRARRQTVTIITSFLTVVLLCAGAVLLVARQQEYEIHEGDVVLYAAADESAPPPQPPDPEVAPPPPAVTVPMPPGNYDFLYRNDDNTPVAWDPCVPIHYVVNDLTEPGGGAEQLAAAIAAVSAATGLQFIDDGPSAEQPAFDRSVVEGDGANRRWRPVLIAWTSAGQVPELAGDVVGIGIPRRVASTTSGLARHVSGMVILDGPDLARVIGEAGGAGARGIIEHELGHLLGLGHVDDPSQLMNPSTDLHVNDLQDGDLAGLSVLGRGRCFSG